MGRAPAFALSHGRATAPATRPGHRTPVPRPAPGTRAAVGGSWKRYFHCVETTNPTAMKPKPTTMFQSPSASTGSEPEVR